MEDLINQLNKLNINENYDEIQTITEGVVNLAINKYEMTQEITQEATREITQEITREISQKIMSDNINTPIDIIQIIAIAIYNRLGQRCGDYIAPTIHDYVF